MSDDANIAQNNPAADNPLPEDRETHFPSLFNGRLQCDFINALGVLAAITGVLHNTQSVRDAWAAADGIMAALVFFALCVVAWKAWREYRSGAWNIGKWTLASYAGVLGFELILLVVCMVTTLSSDDLTTQIVGLGLLVTAQAFLHIVRLIVLSRGGISRREFLTGLIVIVGAIAIAAGVWLTVAGQGFAATLIGALGWIVAEIGGGIDTFAQRNQPRRGFDRQDRAPPAFWELCLAGLRGAAIIIAMLFALATAIMDAAWLTAPVDFFAIIAKGILVQFGNMVSLVIASIGLVFGVILAIANLIVKLRKPQQAGAVPMGPIVGGGGAGGDDDDDAGPVPRVRQRRRREAYQKHLVKVSEAKREARRGRIWRAPE